MAPVDDDSWPPGDIRAMIAEMRSDLESPHWNRVRMQVYGYARHYSIGSHECLADAEDITQDVMWTLTRPGKLEAFGRKARIDTAKPDEAPLLRVAFLAWLAVITRRRWLNLLRYIRSRPDLQSGVSLNDDEDDGALVEIPDPRVDVAHAVIEKMQLEAVIEYLQMLQRRNPETARKVAQLAVLALTNMSYEEIARRFNCTIPQVRDAIHRIRSLLRQQFGVQEEGPPDEPSPPPG